MYTVYRTVFLFICLGRFHILAFVNNAAVMMVYKYSLRSCFQFVGAGYAEVEMLGPMVILFHFWRSYHPVFYSGYTHFIPNEQGTIKSLPFYCYCWSAH